MQTAIIIVLFLIAIVVIAIVAGIIRVERKADVSSARAVAEAPATPPPEEPEELIDLVDYYADVEEERREAAPEQRKEKPPNPESSAVDKLSNLKVGRGYLLDCQNLLHEAMASKQKYALIYFDFNRFRFINSLKGYSSGDYALTRIAQEAKAILPADALTTRLTADHFASLFPFVMDTQIESILEGLTRCSERIRSELGVKSGLQICMGVALTGLSDSYDIFTLLRRANIARHCIKAARSEHFSMFDDAMLTSYLFGESSLDDYNEHQYGDEYTLFLHPQLRLATRRVTSCMGHIIWDYERTTNNAVSLEACGIIPTSTAKTVYHVCRAMSRWRKSEATLIPVMVKLSEIDLFKENIDEFFVRCLSEFQLESAYLTLGVSLHSIRLNPEIVLGQLKKLEILGVRLAVCDIDRGIESLEMLREYPVNAVVLHQSFCHELDRNPERQEAALKIIAQAKGLGLDTIFEGVGSAACSSWLSGSGATLAQGRYVGNPMVPEEFIRELHGVLAPEHYDPSATIVLDDKALQKGEFHVF